MADGMEKKGNEKQMMGRMDFMREKINRGLQGEDFSIRQRENVSRFIFLLFFPFIPFQAHHRPSLLPKPVETAPLPGIRPQSDFLAGFYAERGGGVRQRLPSRHPPGHRTEVKRMGCVKSTGFSKRKRRCNVNCEKQNPVLLVDILIIYSNGIQI